MTKIPGVGQKRAQEIIAERDRQGVLKALMICLKFQELGKKPWIN
ncbi:hypothetical protein ABG811_09770 [Streptococcus iniae]